MRLFRTNYPSRGHDSQAEPGFRVGLARRGQPTKMAAGMTLSEATRFAPAPDGKRAGPSPGGGSSRWGLGGRRPDVAVRG